MPPIEPIDVGVNLQGVAEVGRMQQNEKSQPLVQALATDASSRDQAQDEDKRVQGNPESGEGDGIKEREARGGTNEEQRRGRRKKEESQEKAIDPDKGNFLDITS